MKCFWFLSPKFPWKVQHSQSTSQQHEVAKRQKVASSTVFLRYYRKKIASSKGKKSSSKANVHKGNPCKLLTWQDSPGKSLQIQFVCALKKQQGLSSPSHILLCREKPVQWCEPRSKHFHTPERQKVKGERKKDHMKLLIKGNNPVKNRLRLVGSVPVRKITWRRKWQLTPIFLPGKFHGQRSVVGDSPWGCKRVRHDLVTKQQQRTDQSILSDLNTLHKIEIIWK